MVALLEPKLHPRQMGVGLAKPGDCIVRLAIDLRGRHGLGLCDLVDCHEASASGTDQVIRLGSRGLVRASGDAQPSVIFANDRQSRLRTQGWDGSSNAADCRDGCRLGTADQTPADLSGIPTR
jgi:hypothetical protein